MSAMIEELDDEILDFYENHCAEPGGVVLAQIFYDDGTHENGIFSTLVLADRWANTNSNQEGASVVFVPYVVDVPEYGNTIGKDMN